MLKFCFFLEVKMSNGLLMLKFETEGYMLRIYIYIYNFSKGICHCILYIEWDNLGH